MHSVSVYVVHLYSSTDIATTLKKSHSSRNKDDLISDVLLWTPAYGCASVGQPTRTYIHLLCVNTRSSQEELTVLIEDRDGYLESVRELCAVKAT